ncbi:hypothetical protein GXW83_11570 [Streptacidiphilus sp. PB12-B1b]|nr:hypothetical protein GXW83_11570 [Streptacidiphilus sp. PB12-B1b]
MRAVLSALDSPTAVRAVRTSAMRHRRGQLAPAHALPVHLLDPVTPQPVAPLSGAHAPDGLLAGARRTGWRFLIRDGEEVVAAAETRETADGHVFAYFAEGPYPASTLRALHQARAHTAVSPTPYVPRLLSVPGRYMTALWLHPVLDPARSRDLLIPLAPAPLGVTAHVAHDAEELLALLANGNGSLLTAAS